jgi:polyhydroxyalkanoate synthesis regulator phasin
MHSKNTIDELSKRRKQNTNKTKENSSVQLKQRHRKHSIFRRKTWGEMTEAVFDVFEKVFFPSRHQ